MLSEPDVKDLLCEISPRIAERDEILLNHSIEYFRQAKQTDGVDHSALSADTHTSAGSYRAAILAAGGMIKAVETALSGDCSRIFCLQRPPGHHAERGRAMGFCIFNNVAVAAHYARKMLGLKRVLIVDWDVHHGNGTQHSFEDDPSVLFFSTHQFPHFPGTGLYTEAGIGKGEGFTINLALGRGYGDAEYAAIYEKILKKVAFEFGPEIVLVSAGFDVHKSDPLGGMKLTPEGFAAVARSVMNVADSCCGGKIVFTLEGGYNLKVLGASVKAVLREMTGQTVSDPEQTASMAKRKKVDYVLKRCLHVHRNFWKSLKDLL
jgi:acetoin utilization deacetylase AcuC-like enzyme